MARHLSLGCDRAERVVCSVRTNDQSAWANRRGAGHLRHARGGGGARGDHLGRDDYAVDVGRLPTGSGRSGGVQSGSLACSRCNEAYQRILPGFSPKVYCVRKLTHPIASRCARHRKKILLLKERIEAEPANLANGQAAVVRPRWLTSSGCIRSVTWRSIPPPRHTVA